MIRILFYVMALAAVGSAVFVAGTKSLVRSVFMFFVTLFALAGLYILSLADFVAITQVVIYVGGILVLILFAFMLSGRETLNAVLQQKSRFINVNKVLSLILALLFLGVLLLVIFKADVDNLTWVKRSVTENNVIKPNDDTTQNIGINLMTRYLLPFEAISVLLMIALVGAAHLARKEPEQ